MPATSMHRCFMRRRLAALAVTTALAAAPALAQTAGDTPAPTDFTAAVEAYERNHWPQAYAAFSGLADRGDPQAARIALLMQRHGATLYGQVFDATPYQQLRWAWLMQCGGACAAPVQAAASGC